MARQTSGFHPDRTAIELPMQSGIAAFGGTQMTQANLTKMMIEKLASLMTSSASRGFGAVASKQMSIGPRISCPYHPHQMAP